MSMARLMDGIWIQYGDEEDKDSVKMSVSGDDTSSSGEMELRATKNRKKSKKPKSSRKQKKSSKSVKKS